METVFCSECNKIYKVGDTVRYTEPYFIGGALFNHPKYLCKECKVKKDFRPWLLKFRD